MSMTYINWYPGHMKKTKDMINENIKLVDVVLEVIDARIPMSSRNPDIKKISKNKKRVIVLNKTDLVNKDELKLWKEYFIYEDNADGVIEISAETGKNLNLLYKEIEKVNHEKKEKLKEKGIKNLINRIMVLGIPNVGKSRLINRIVGKNSAGVGNKPGFTKGKQWIRIKDGYELLDTPGILWPKFDNREVGINLAITGAIKDEILPVEDIACEFLKKMISFDKYDIVEKTYKLLPEDRDENVWYIIEKIAIRMGMLLKGNKPNTLQACYTLLRDYRSGKLGKIILEDISQKNKE